MGRHKKIDTSGADKVSKEESDKPTTEVIKEEVEVIARETQVSADEWDMGSSLESELTIEELVSSPVFKNPSDEKDLPTAGTRIPRWLEREFIMLVENRGTPYQIKGDVYRDALHLGIQILKLRYIEDPDWLARTKMTKIADDVAELNRMNSQIDKLEGNLDFLVRNGWFDKAYKSISAYVNVAKNIQDVWLLNLIFSRLDKMHLVRDVLGEKDEDMLKMIKKFADQKQLPKGRG